MLLALRQLDNRLLDDRPPRILPILCLFCAQSRQVHMFRYIHIRRSVGVASLFGSGWQIGERPSDIGDLLNERQDRFHSLLIQALHVETAGVDRLELALIVVICRVLRGGDSDIVRADRVKDFEDDLLIAVGNDVEGAVDTLVSGDLVRFEPAAIWLSALHRAGQ